MKLWMTQELDTVQTAEGIFKTDTSCGNTQPRKDNSRCAGHSKLHSQEIRMVVVGNHWEWHEVQLWENIINRDV